MTYQPRKGFFIVGLLTTPQSKGGGTGTIDLDEFYTSSGLLSSTPSASGLAISETRCDNVSGYSPYFSQCPTSSGGFGVDLPPALGSRGCGVTLGCAVLSSNTVEIYYSNYDADRVLVDSYCAVFGEQS
jgi:hypothetical protein